MITHSDVPGIIVNCFNIRGQGLTALFLMDVAGKTKNHSLLVKPGLDVAPLRTSRKQFPKMTRVTVTWTENETTGTKILVSYTIQKSKDD